MHREQTNNPSSVQKQYSDQRLIMLFEIQFQTQPRSLACPQSPARTSVRLATSHKLGRAVALASVPCGTSVKLNSTTTRLTFKTHSQCQRSAPAKSRRSLFLPCSYA
jgi:hypothetical protein